MEDLNITPGQIVALLTTSLAIALGLVRILEKVASFGFKAWRVRNGHMPGEDSAAVEELRIIRTLLEDSTKNQDDQLRELKETRRRVDERHDVSARARGR